MLALIILMTFVLITGLCIGSFLNVVVLRALSGESIVFPASKCPKCQHPLKWYHNIPVLSYIILKGQCAFCKEKISIQYPIVELFTGLMFLLVFFKYMVSVNALFYWYFISLFIVISVTDLKEKVIFVRHTYFLIGGALLYNLLNLNPLYNGYIGFVPDALINSVIGMVAGIIIMELLARTGYIFAGTRAFGEGDTYIAAGMGALFGWRVFVLALLMSVVIQLIVIIPMFIFKLFKNKDFITILAFVFFGAILMFNKALPFAISTVLLVLGGGFLCYRILKDLKKGEELIYLPFGPAMMLASAIFMFLM